MSPKKNDAMYSSHFQFSFNKTNTKNRTVPKLMLQQIVVVQIWHTYFHFTFFCLFVSGTCAFYFVYYVVGIHLFPAPELTSVVPNFHAYCN